MKILIDDLYNYIDKRFYIIHEEEKRIKNVKPEHREMVKRQLRGREKELEMMVKFLESRNQTNF